ncbi:MAG: hypothetical protein ACPG5B_01995 [Chitinophagales bacterium]
MLNVLRFALVSVISVVIAIIIYPFLVQLSFLILEKMQLLHDFYNSEMMFSFRSKAFFIIAFFILSSLLFKEKIVDIIKGYFMYILIGFAIGIVAKLPKILTKSDYITYQIDFEYYGYVYIICLTFFFVVKKMLFQDLKLIRF